MVKKMRFPDEYYEDEVRCGFYVNGQMKCCWAAQIQTLEAIDSLCKKHNIQYFAEYGTLLGTIRHGGCIPWDDDMDICMKRADYEKFLRVAPSELPDGYETLNYAFNEDYWDIMSRVVNTSYTNFSSEFLNEYNNFPFAVGVDIFPLDYVLPSKEEVDEQREIVDLVKGIADTYGEHGMDPLVLNKYLTKVERTLKVKIDRRGDIRTQLYAILMKLYALGDDKSSTEIALMAHYLEKGRSVYPKRCYSFSVKMPYDSFMIPVPIGYDELLSKKYRNYMKNVRKGGSHEYPYYEKQIVYAKEHGVDLDKKYAYDNRIEKSRKNETFIQSVQNHLELLIQINENVLKLLSSGQPEIAMELIAKGQEIASLIGEMYESKVGPDAACIPVLEQFCETLFRLYQLIDSVKDVNVQGVGALMAENLSALVDCISATGIKKEVVIFPYRHTQWEYIEPIWKKYSEDPEVDVKVIPIPYYYKYELGDRLSDLKCDAGLFPDYVTVLNYLEYHLEINHPDEIYIQQPWDHMNYTLTVSDYYYADRLWANTEKLIYIPPFDLSEFEESDERALKNRKYYMPMPGVAWADQIFVQSEGIRANYIEYLSEWAGDTTKTIWENKISVRDYEIIREEGQNEKCLIMFYSLVNALSKGKQAVSKIKKNLETILNSPIKVYWLQDYGYDDHYNERGDKILKEIKAIISEYASEDNIEIVSPDRMNEMISRGTAYYGDKGRCAQLMQEAGKPVMIMDYEI